MRYAQWRRQSQSKPTSTAGDDSIDWDLTQILFALFFIALLYHNYGDIHFGIYWILVIMAGITILTNKFERFFKAIINSVFGINMVALALALILYGGLFILGLFLTLLGAEFYPFISIMSAKTYVSIVLILGMTSASLTTLVK
ncbi:hypothetical protein Mevan_0094 [Methanococcus vannielii SB]|uniref:Uncharacterized protein n=1 Tax=Methanococcus vannielii (strain ATCC 35089 / DSM 1224 / JCM 13029 / OCM 148 / SB) TaxID=406327 RepID=A6UND6_METVS|nr:hypothetical protein [Methanococcus vannielii]ABR54008.1 hypothetical protein Mevan_0094 [Methanococcus vannielii SB]